MLVVQVLQASSDQSPGPIIIASLVLIGLGVAGFLLVSWVRRRMLESDGDTSDASRQAGFSLFELRQLHKQGKLTDEEFARARDAMTAKLRAVTSEKKDMHDKTEKNESGMDEKG